MDLTSLAKRQSGSATFTITMVEDELVPALWQRLPPDLCEKVLSKLPLSALRKFSRVSKRWKALFRSVEFARECDSTEWTFFYLDLRGDISYMLLPNLRTNSWDKHSLDFLHAHEVILGYHVVVDSGLVCYRILKKSPWITLVVQNPLTRKWRRLIVPHQLEPGFSSHKIIWGLMMDQENGNYKVVVAFCAPYLPRKAFVYDSISNSWSVCAALTPARVSHFDSFDSWEVLSVVCSSGELLWLVKELQTDGLIYRWLIKYNFELDAWSMVTQNSPLDVEGEVYLVHHEVKNRPMMVNFFPNYVILSRTRFPSEFLELDPNLGKVGIEDIDRLVNEAGNTELADFMPDQVAFGGGTWYILPDSTYYKDGLDVFAVSENPPTVTRLPKIYNQIIVSCGTLAATLKAFV